MTRPLLLDLFCGAGGAAVGYSRAGFDVIGVDIRWNWEFIDQGERCIYHLFDADGEPLYFGKAWCPLYRFEKHQRRPWWPAVAHLNLYKVSCESHRHKPCNRPLDSVAIEWEHYAIARVQPRHNKAAKVSAPMERDG